MERVSALSFAEERVTCRQSRHEIERHMALKQSVIGQDAAHNLNSVITKQQHGLVAQQDESSAKSVSQPDLHREMLARVKEIDEDDNKLFAEYQQDIQLDQPGEFKQKLKGLCCRFASSAFTRRAKMLHHGSPDAEQVECRQPGLPDPQSVQHRQPRVQRDACTDCPRQCCFGRNQGEGRQRKFHHTVGAWKTANICSGRSQNEAVLFVALGGMRCVDRCLGSKRHSA